MEVLVLLLVFLVDEFEEVLSYEGDREGEVEFISVVVDNFRPATFGFPLLHQDIHSIGELIVNF